MDVFAEIGERVQDHQTGKVICHVAKPLIRYSAMTVDSFSNFAEGETPWKAGDLIDKRCTKAENGNFKIFIEGEWRPT